MLILIEKNENDLIEKNENLVIEKQLTFLPLGQTDPPVRPFL